MSLTGTVFFLVFFFWGGGGGLGKQRKTLETKGGARGLGFAGLCWEELGGSVNRTTSANPKAVEAVLSSSISEKLAGMEIVKELRRHMRRTDGGAVSKIANALGSVGHYDKEILVYVKLTSSLQVHQEKPVSWLHCRGG